MVSRCSWLSSISCSGTVRGWLSPYRALAETRLPPRTITVYSKPLSIVTPLCRRREQDRPDALQVDDGNAEQAGILVRGKRARDFPAPPLGGRVHGQAFGQGVIEGLGEGGGALRGDRELHGHHARHAVAGQLRGGSREADLAVDGPSLARMKEDYPGRSPRPPEELADVLGRY